MSPKSVVNNLVFCIECQLLLHKKCSGIKGKLILHWPILHKNLKEVWDFKDQLMGNLKRICYRDQDRMQWSFFCYLDGDLCAGEGCKICCITVVTWTLQVNVTSQPAFTCLKLTIETLEEGVKYVQS